MRLAIVSDSHDHVKNLDQAIEMIGRMGITVLIHCWDLCSPFMIDTLARFQGDAYFVYGNNEGGRKTISRIAERYPNVNILGEVGTLDAGSGAIARTHHPEYGHELDASGKYSADFRDTSMEEILKRSGISGTSNRQNLWA